MRLSPTVQTLQTSLTVLTLLTLLSCAQMQVPGGGPRDVSPPRAIHYLPDSGKVNFTGDEVRITFDENIVLKDVQNQMIISPPLTVAPDITLLKNRIVRIKFREALKPNTTYGIYFGNAIADVHEGNTAEGFRYLFSTGPVLDVLMCIGAIASNGRLFLTANGSGLQASMAYGDEVTR